jgi:hypothetical protein
MEEIEGQGPNEEGKVWVKNADSWGNCPTMVLGWLHPVTHHKEIECSGRK